MSFGVAAVAAAGEEIFSADEGVALAAIFIIPWDFEDGFAELFKDGFGIRFLGFAGVWQASENGLVAVAESPVGGIDAVLTIFGWLNLDDFDAGLFKSGTDGGMFGNGGGDVDGFLTIIRVNRGIGGEKVGAGHE